MGRRSYLGIRQLKLFAFFASLLAAGCSSAEPPAAIAFELSGHLEDDKIREASGLARSQLTPGNLWIINDNGAKERVHAIAADGSRLGEFDVSDAKNRDWEDLASFRKDGTPYLMVADIGDNDAKRSQRTLYFVVEPQPEKKAQADLGWRVDYQYPDGPRDAESAAVDVDSEQVLILSKRDRPPQLYAVPMKSDASDPVTAEFLGLVNSLHQPTQHEIAMAPKLKDWFWQPVAMDIATDNLAAVILTYRAVYYFERETGQSWLDALNTAPLRIGIGNLENAEAVAFADDQRTVVVTGENKNSPIIRVNLQGVVQQ